MIFCRWETLEGADVALAQRFRDQQLNMLDVHARFQDGSVSVEAGLIEMLTRMATGKLKVFSTLLDWSRSFGCPTGKTAGGEAGWRPAIGHPLCDHDASLRRAFIGPTGATPARALLGWWARRWRLDERIEATNAPLRLFARRGHTRHCGCLSHASRTIELVVFEVRLRLTRSSRFVIPRVAHLLDNPGKHLIRSRPLRDASFTWSP
ncbi:hypothetical protein ABIB94_002297 [Bradyrhizobium sp. JR7.2]